MRALLHTLSPTSAHIQVTITDIIFIPQSSAHYSVHLRCEAVHVRVSVLPHGGPDLATIDQPHVRVKVGLPNIGADGGKQVDECL